MERAFVTRLYRDESSQDTIMLMEGAKSKEQFKVRVPWHRAGILAMEAHGLNDRCPLYGILSQCVSEMGGSFGSVVITKFDSRTPICVISLSRGGRTTWVDGDVTELVAFAMHARVPIYLTAHEETQPTLPRVFEDVLADVLGRAPDTEPQA